jgi:hypothetical protein
MKELPLEKKIAERRPEGTIKGVRRSAACPPRLCVVILHLAPG